MKYLTKCLLKIGPNLIRFYIGKSNTVRLIIVFNELGLPVYKSCVSKGSGSAHACLIYRKEKLQKTT